MACDGDASGPLDPFFAARNRAYDLADGGRYKDWPDIQRTLRMEGFDQNILDRLGDDREVVLMLRRCCTQARG